MRPTVHDLAEAAGVSLATVDRVINRRPGVKAATRAHVEAVIDQIGFVRDIAAANLAKGRVYPLVFVLPQGDNDFMDALRAEIDLAMARSAQERTAIRLVEVPPFDGPALAAALETVQAERPAGVAVVAVDHPAVHAAIAGLRAAGIAVVTLVSDLPATMRDHFAGIDNMAAGRTAAGLMANFLRRDTGDIAIIAGSLTVADHRDRLSGFLSALAARHPGLHALPVMEGHDDAAEVERLVRDCLARHPDLKGIYSLGAGNRGLIAALSSGSIPSLSASPTSLPKGERGIAIASAPPSPPPGEMPRRGREGPSTDGKSRPVVILHELTPASRKALGEGLIDVVLNQDPGHEVRSAIRVLKAKADGQAVIAAQERIRLDIFVSDNLP